MQVRKCAFYSAVFMVLVTLPCLAQAHQPEWLKDLAAHLPQFILRVSPIGRAGTPSPDGKWLAATYELNPNSNLGPDIVAEQHGVQILDRTGNVVQDVTRGHDFFSVDTFVWGKDCRTIYFEYGSRMHPGNRGDVLESPVIYRADLGTGKLPTTCTKTTFTQMPIWSPQEDSYLITERDRRNVKLNGSGERFNVVLIDIKRKIRIKFHDAEAPAWSPDGRWILLVNLPPDRQDPYLRIADSRNGKERAFTDMMSSVAENRRYGWESITFSGAEWLADSKHLLLGVTATRKDGVQVKGSYIVSSLDGPRSIVPGIYPLCGSRDGRTILIERPDKQLFLLDLSPKQVTRKPTHRR